MRSLSNLVKSAFVVQKNADRVIDSNQKVADRIRILAEQMELENREPASDAELSEGFIEGLNVAEVEGLFLDQDAEETVQTNEQLESLRAEADRMQMQAEQLLADAKTQADALLKDADAQVRQMLEEARAQGRKEGFDAGYADGRNQFQEAEMNLAERERQLTRSYQEKVAEIEPSLVSAITDIYESVLGIDLAGRRDVVLYLLQKAMQTIEGGSHYLVHVSCEDAAFVTERKELLTQGIGSKDTLDLIEDKTLAQGQCYIETESGIFDCSLGVEMDMLRKELQLLSRSEPQHGSIQ